MKTTLFLDTETTGVSTTKSRLVSICWAVYDQDTQPVLREHRIVRPDGFTIPDDAARIHGLTTRIALKKGMPLVSVLEELNRDLERLGPQLYVGHNIAFDRPILLTEFSRAGLREKLSAVPTLCTMRTSTNICRIPRWGGSGYKWPTLTELHTHVFGVPHDGAHSAHGDVDACARCFYELIRSGHLKFPGRS